MNEITIIEESTLKSYLDTLTNKLNESEQMQFLELARAMNLNPFKKEIYAVKYGNSFSLIIGFEVYLKRAEQSKKLDGWEVTSIKEGGKLISSTCSVYRKDMSRPITRTVYFDEYNTGVSLWKTKPTVMLEKVAIATAFRQAFPNELGGAYIEEEIAKNEEATTVEIISQPDPFCEPTTIDSKVEEIEKLLAQKKVKKNSLLSSYGVAELGELTLDQCNDAIVKLNAKINPKLAKVNINDI